MVNWSVVLVLDLSVANGNSHELVSVDVVALHAVVMGGFGHGPSVDLSLVGNELGGRDLLGDLSELDELIASGLSDWDDLLNNVPHDSFGHWGGGEGTLVGESSVEVNGVDKLGQIKAGFLSGGQFTVGIIGALGWLVLDFFQFFLINELSQKFIMVALGLVLIEPSIWHDLEEESEDTVAELGGLSVTSWQVSGGMLLLQFVNNMHLEVEKLTVKGVLGWGVEMVLETVEVGALDMGVEEGDGAGVHEVVLDKGVVSVLHVLEWEDEGLGTLSKLVGELGLDYLIVAFEHIILEFL